MSSLIIYNIKILYVRKKQMNEISTIFTLNVNQTKQSYKYNVGEIQCKLFSFKWTLNGLI